MSSELSYASVHWPDSGYLDRQPYSPELVDVANMELIFRAASNDYADKGNFDYARRVVETGAEIVDAGLVVTRGEQGSEARQQAVRGLWAIASQIYEESLDRSRVPSMQWKDYFVEPDSDIHIPEELLQFYKDVWGEFAKQYDIEVTFGYEQHQ